MIKKTANISWDEYFMGMALLSSQRSKDPSTQVGACIVDKNNRIVSLGYNGFPNGISDDEFSWERSGESKLDTKYVYVCHAEENAILNARGKDLSGCKIYVTLFPCNECAKMIIQTGIAEVVYFDNKYAHTEETIASKRMLDRANVKLTEYSKSGKKLTIEV